MNKNLIVIKIGGSIIFNKNGDIDEKLINELFKIFSLLKTPKIVVFGCGKKLHDLTYKYNLTDKPKTNKGQITNQSERLAGFFEIYKTIKKNLLKMTEIASNFEKPVSIHPVNLFIKKSEGSKNLDEIVWSDENIFDNTDYLFTSGGIVLDKNILVSAISSDTIAAYLAKKYKAKRVILLSDVDGVYKDFEQKEVLKEIKLSEIEKYKITEGMADKLRRISPIICAGIPVQIVNGRFPERVFEILTKGNSSVFSQIEP